MDAGSVVLRRVDEEFVECKERVSLVGGMVAKRAEDRPIEPLARGEVPNAKMHVIDEPSLVEFHGFLPWHALASWTFPMP